MIAVIVPVYKQQFIYTLRQQIYLEHDYVDLFVVDNGNDYKDEGWEIVLDPKENLGWAKGTNLGLKGAKNLADYNEYVMLNDDVSLSPNFFQNLAKSLVQEQAGIVGPLYDDVWEAQRGPYNGPAGAFMGSDAIRPAPFVDGTCLMVSKNCFDVMGYLDADNFGEYGFGADMDYCLRAKELGYKVIVSEAAYLNHYHQGTAKTISDNWTGLAGAEMDRGMHNKYGPGWSERVWR